MSNVELFYYFALMLFSQSCANNCRACRMRAEFTSHSPQNDLATEIMDVETPFVSRTHTGFANTIHCMSLLAVRTTRKLQTHTYHNNIVCHRDANGHRERMYRATHVTIKHPTADTLMFSCRCGHKIYMLWLSGSVSVLSCRKYLYYYIYIWMDG